MDPCYRANRPQNTIGFQYTHKWTPLLPSGGPIDATILTRTSIDRCLPTSLDIIVAIDEMMSVTWHVVSWSCHDIEVSIIPQAIAALRRSEWSKLLSACWWFPPAWAIRYENQLGSLSSLKNDDWLVVQKPSWTIWKSMRRMTSHIWNGKTCLKPPTRWIFAITSQLL